MCFFKCQRWCDTCHAANKKVQPCMFVTKSNDCAVKCTIPSRNKLLCNMVLTIHVTLRMWPENIYGVVTGTDIWYGPQLVLYQQRNGWYLAIQLGFPILHCLLCTVTCKWTLWSQKLSSSSLCHVMSHYVMNASCTFMSWFVYTQLYGENELLHLKINIFHCLWS